MKERDWVTVNPGDPDAHPVVNIANLTNEQVGNMINWKENMVANENDLGTLNDIDDSITSGRVTGHDAASSFHNY